MPEYNYKQKYQIGREREREREKEIMPGKGVERKIDEE